MGHVRNIQEDISSLTSNLDYRNFTWGTREKNGAAYAAQLTSTEEELYLLSGCKTLQPP